jgi:tRNA dimethylallyltransferase
MRTLDTHALVIAGPTASGKSALALDLARAFGGTIINADSMQVYNGIEILTSQPGAEARARHPHRLYGVLDVADPCSAARWRDLARIEIANTAEAGRLPILVGGTGFYLKTLARGIVPVPPIPEEARADARRRHAAIGGEAFRSELAKLDPDSAERLHSGDTQRLVRAYEVAVGTGAALPEWQRRARETAEVDDGLRLFTIVLDPPRSDLRAAIARRLDAMVDAGVLDEVAALLARKLPPDLPPMKALGVRELARHIGGSAKLADALAAAATATGQYAKRQATWFRHQMFADIALREKFSESINDNIHSLVSKFLLTGKD